MLKISTKFMSTYRFFKKRYQITNPAYVVPSERESFVKKIIAKYSLTEGISEKIYRNIIEQVLTKLPVLPEWHNSNVLKVFDNKNWKDSVLHLHNPKNKHDRFSTYYKRLAYDEIISGLLVLSQLRKKIKKIKKNPKKFKESLSKKLIQNFNFKLTKNQKDIILKNTEVKAGQKGEKHKMAYSGLAEGDKVNVTAVPGSNDASSLSVNL